MRMVPCFCTKPDNFHPRTMHGLQSTPGSRMAQQHIFIPVLCTGCDFACQLTVTSGFVFPSPYYARVAIKMGFVELKAPGFSSPYSLRVATLSLIAYYLRLLFHPHALYTHGLRQSCQYWHTRQADFHPRVTHGLQLPAAK